MSEEGSLISEMRVSNMPDRYYEIDNGMRTVSSTRLALWIDEVERLEALPERITKLAEKLREYQTETRRDAMKHNSERLLGYAAGIDACAAELLILLTNPQGDSK